MKSFYLLTVICGVLLTLGSCIVPASSGFPIDRMLVSHPQEWQLTFTTPDRRLARLPEDAAKARLLHFLHSAHDDSTNRAAWLTTSLSLVLFGVLGWRRELHFERMSKPDDASRSLLTS